MSSSVAYKINGETVSKEEWDRYMRDRPRSVGVPMTANTYRGHEPLESLALSCHRDMVPEYRDKAKRLGLTGIKWDKDGDCTITSRRDRATWLRSQEQSDADGGYSD
jgi:hypothetical protein